MLIAAKILAWKFSLPGFSWMSPWKAWTSIFQERYFVSIAIEQEFPKTFVQCLNPLFMLGTINQILHLAGVLFQIVQFVPVPESMTANVLPPASNDGMQSRCVGIIAFPVVLVQKIRPFQLGGIAVTQTVQMLCPSMFAIAGDEVASRIVRHVNVSNKTAETRTCGIFPFAIISNGICGSLHRRYACQSVRDPQTENRCLPCK